MGLAILAYAVLVIVSIFVKISVFGIQVESVFLRMLLGPLVLMLIGVCFALAAILTALLAALLLSPVILLYLNL